MKTTLYLKYNPFSTIYPNLSLVLYAKLYLKGHTNCLYYKHGFDNLVILKHVL